MTCELSQAEIVARLEQLERDRTSVELLARQCRLWRRAALATVAVSVVLLFGGGADDSPRTEVFERIVIQDPNGKDRIVLGFEKFHKDSDDHMPGLYVLDEHGQRRVMLGGDDKVAGLWLADDAKTRISITSTPGKRAGLGIFGEAGKPDRGQIGLYYTDDGNPLMTMNDRYGATRIGMGLFDRGKPALSLNDQSGKAIFSQGEP